MKVDIHTMEGLLRGKCLPAKILVGESLSAYLVRQFDALHERAEAAERERDELKQRLANAEHQLHMAELAKFNLRNQRKAQFRKRREAEAEIVRRDAAAGDSRKIFTCSGCGAEGLDEPLESRCHCCIAGAHWVEGKLYTAAQPALLPPEMTIDRMDCELTDFGKAISCAAYNQCRADALALGAQQQKVVELPTPFDVEINLTRACGDIEYKYHESGEHFDRDDVLEVLDASGVKWEVKK